MTAPTAAERAKDVTETFAKKASDYIWGCDHIHYKDADEMLTNHILAALVAHAAEAVRVERERCYRLVKERWSFNSGQEHTHTWHTMQDCLEAIRKGE